MARKPATETLPGDTDLNRDIEKMEEGDAKPGETKAEKFTRLAKARTNRTLAAIRGIGKLSAAGYESTEEQKAKLFGAIRKALDDAEARFQPKVKAGADAFDF